MTRYWLVRHGQIDANTTLHWHGSTDSALTETGRRQARQVADWFARSGHPVRQIYTSPLQRTRHTAEAIADALGLSLEQDPDLREYGIGELEGTHYRDLAEDGFFDRIRARPDWAPAGGEALRDVIGRMLGALERIGARHPGEDVVIVSHGAAMAMTLAHLLDDDPLAWHGYSLGNCSVTEFWLRPNARLGLHNHTGHLLD